jgi:hypothetical protein
MGSRRRLSNVIAGRVVMVAGSDAALMSMGVVAAMRMALCAAVMPETGPDAAANGAVTPTYGLPRTGEAGR